MDVLGHDGVTAERAWLAGDTLTAIDAADRALAAGADADCRAASVAAAAAAADGGLREAAQRWRAVAGALEGTPVVWALGRAALTAALSGDVTAAARDVDEACARMPEPAPRGLGVVVCGAQAALQALSGEFSGAARTLTGLAAATVPPDPLAVERWDELAATVVAASGDDRTARAMLAAVPGTSTARRRLLAGWFDLRRARLPEARTDGGGEYGVAPQHRSGADGSERLAGLARRAAGTPDGAARLMATWHQVTPAVAGADVEVLLLDVWGELSVAAAHISPTDRDSLAEAMAATVARAGSPAWLVAADAWWRVERAAVARDAAAAADAAAVLAALAAALPDPAPVGAAASGTAAGAASGAAAASSVARSVPRASEAPARPADRITLLAEAAAAWAAVLAAAPDPAAVVAVAGRLTTAGRRVEAAALCTAAAETCSDAAAVRELLGAGRDLRTTVAGPAGLLSEREQAVGTLVVDGLTHKEIGARLYISPKTVEQHVARLRRKLAATNRAELVAALRAHLPTP